jgi:LysR family transcriptional regulator, transcriptional activator for dmlA
MLNNVAELRTFARIAAAGSLSAAARDMGVALSVVRRIGWSILSKNEWMR